MENERLYRQKEELKKQLCVINLKIHKIEKENRKNEQVEQNIKDIRQYRYIYKREILRIIRKIRGILIDPNIINIDIDDLLDDIEELELELEDLLAMIYRV